MPEIQIVPGPPSLDIPVILELIRGLAEYEKLSHLVVATEERLRESLFRAQPFAEVLLARENGVCEGFALFFHNYSTFLAQPGIYLEDLYVRPHARGRGLGIALFRQLAQIALERRCGRHRMGSARLERTIHQLLQIARRGCHGRLDALPPFR